MRLMVLALGTSPPAWAREATDDYGSRLRAPYRLELRRLDPGTRGRRSDPLTTMAGEAKLLRAATPAGSVTVALDRQGQAWSTEELAARLEGWSLGGQTLCFWIGGAEGIHPDLLAQADWRWSLSRLTLPHALAQVVVVEQLYRAWSLIRGLPYHRA